MLNCYLSCLYEFSSYYYVIIILRIINWRVLMKRAILFLMILSFFTACETGTRYEKNTTTHKKVILTDRSDGIPKEIDDLVSDDEELEDDDSLIADPVPDKAYVDDDEYIEDSVESDTFDTQEVNQVGLDVHNIRVGQHDDYTRLVMDIYEDSHKATSVGSYSAKYYANRGEIVVMLNGYSNFSASLPSFPSNSIIDQIEVNIHNSKSGYRFSIKLRQDAKVKIFDLKNPARLVFDIKPI